MSAYGGSLDGFIDETYRAAECGSKSGSACVRIVPEPKPPKGADCTVESSSPDLRGDGFSRDDVQLPFTITVHVECDDGGGGVGDTTTEKTTTTTTTKKTTTTTTTSS